jgi:hypothetical protein
MSRSLLALAALIFAAQLSHAQSKPADTKAKAKVTKPAAPARPGSKLDVAPPPTDTAGPPPSIMREVFAYSRDGRRDPFVSLLTTNELRPAISDLRLTSILYDPRGGRSLAILRDLGTNAQYRVTEGSPLGRMRVSAIRVKTVVFTIDEFGTTRRDSLMLGDSTKVRGK